MSVVPRLMITRKIQVLLGVYIVFFVPALNNMSPFISFDMQWVQLFISISPKSLARQAVRVVATKIVPLFLSFNNYWMKAWNVETAEETVASLRIWCVTDWAKAMVSFPNLLWLLRNHKGRHWASQSTNPEASSIFTHLILTALWDPALMNFYLQMDHRGTKLVAW